MIKMKLHFKIMLFISALSILFISVFTTIQIQSVLQRLNSYNKFRARVGTIIVKTTFEMMLPAETTEETTRDIFRAAIESFSAEGIVEKISVLSPDGNVIATNDPLVKEFGESKKDIETYLNLATKGPKDAWFYSTINENTKMIDIYIPINVNMVLRGIAKLSFSINNIQQAVSAILIPIILTIAAVIAGNLLLGYILLRIIVRPLKILNIATTDIASGNLDLSVKISTNDEIQELGDTFNMMAIALKKMKELAENANPLTKLPGNTVIREEIESRIRRGEKFVAIHSDLDNFKAYNDTYGIGKGDEVIKFTAEVLQRVIYEKGSPGDFVGHEGGDDFFLITSPEKAESVANTIISEFDTGIKNFYAEGDRMKGYIEAKDRRGQQVKFPMMTISLAGVTNQHVNIDSYGDLTNIAVGVKHKAKEAGRSNFFFDRRKA